MVTNVTSLTGNGLKDWLIQRVTAVYFMLYSFFILGFLLTHPHVNFVSWHAFFSNTLVQIASVLALFALSLHTWIGVWTVTTDYIKCSFLRLSAQMFVLLWLASQLIWGLMIFGLC